MPFLIKCDVTIELFAVKTSNNAILFYKNGSSNDIEIQAYNRIRITFHNHEYHATNHLRIGRGIGVRSAKIYRNSILLFNNFVKASQI